MSPHIWQKPHPSGKATRNMRGLCPAMLLQKTTFWYGTVAYLTLFLSGIAVSGNVYSDAVRTRRYWIKEKVGITPCHSISYLEVHLAVDAVQSVRIPVYRTSPSIYPQIAFPDSFCTLLTGCCLTSILLHPLWTSVFYTFCMDWLCPTVFPNIRENPAVFHFQFSTAFS